MATTQMNITITGGPPFGMVIRGGVDYSTPITVGKVNPKSKAETSGVREGDQILSINNVDVKTATHQKARDLISNTESALILLLLRHNDSNMVSNTTSSKDMSSFVYKNPQVVAEVKIPSPEMQTVTEVKVTNQSSQPAVFQKPIVKVDEKSDQYATGLARNISVKSNPCKSGFEYKSFINQTTSAGYSRDPELAKTNYQATTTEPEKQSSYNSSSNKPIETAQTSTTITTSKPNKNQFGRDTVTTSNDKVVYEPYKPSQDNSSSTERLGNKQKSVGICEGCKQPITSGKHIQLSDKFWHSHHFNCFKCDKSIVSEGFFEEDDKKFCKSCYEKAFAAMCIICNNPITGKYITSLGKSYHTNCFRCFKCNKELEETRYNEHEGRLHCMDCLCDILALKCNGCSKNIIPNQEYLAALGNNYHRGCLLCNICNADLSQHGKFHIVDNKPVCKSHNQ